MNLRDREARGGGAPARLNEIVGLAKAIRLDVAAAEAVRVDRPRPGTLFGSGQIERIGELARGRDAELVVVDGALSPIQQRNLERAWKTKVIDRTGLILEIFGARARTHEGETQVELAALSYQRTRLVRSWTHLERQRGGFGFMGGPGESQLEIDRRLIDERIGRLKRDLEQVRRTRGLHRAARRRTPYPTVALVGYTNAGKSTLFNRLTHAGVLADDMLFATLDPTMRQIRLPSGRAVILSDTVGFISDLPTHLVAAFRATLEEVIAADVVVHVRDAAHPDSAGQKGDVLAVLADLGVKAGARRIIEALNKVDLMSDDERAAALRRAGAGETAVVALSALTGESVDALLAAVDAALAAGRATRVYETPAGAGAAIAWLYDHGEILNRSDRDDQVRMTVRLDDADAARFERRFGLPPSVAEPCETAQ